MVEVVASTTRYNYEVVVSYFVQVKLKYIIVEKFDTE